MRILIGGGGGGVVRVGIILLPKEDISIIRKDLLSQKNDAYESKTFLLKEQEH